MVLKRDSFEILSRFDIRRFLSWKDCHVSVFDLYQIVDDLSSHRLYNNFRTKHKIFSVYYFEQLDSERLNIS